MTSLEQMIVLWREIEKKHFDDFVTDTNRRNDRLHSKAQMVVLALRHYQIELGEWS